MKNKFTKIAEKHNAEIMGYESYRIHGCQCYDIRVFYRDCKFMVFHQAYALGDTRGREAMLRRFEEELTS